MLSIFKNYLPPIRFSIEEQIKLQEIERELSGIRETKINALLIETYTQSDEGVPRLSH